MAPLGGEYQILVASVMKAFDPGASVECGQWVKGPDGRLDMDVVVRGRLGPSEVIMVIECKDYDRRTTGPVGRPQVDALDSKRQDLGANHAMICSNSGFTKDALSKAKRVHIGMISVLKNDDERIKAEIQEKVYFRKFWFHDVDIRYRGDNLEGLPANLHDIRYKGLPVDNWLMHRALLVGHKNPNSTNRLVATHDFIQPTTFEFKDKTVVLHGIDIFFRPEAKWFTQIIRLDASLGLYDYLLQRVKLASGKQQYIIKGLDFDKGEVLDSSPENTDFGFGLQSGEEIDINLSISDLNFAHMGIPKLEHLVKPEDLDLNVTE